MKSTQSCIHAKSKVKRTRLLTMLGGLLLLFPLLLPATALAAPRNAAAAPPLTKPQQIVDLAGVSVVRLSLDYLPVKGTTSIFCTALGTIIASWPAQNANDQNNWVLTDGSLLLASKKNTCAPGGTLKSIQIFASNEFTNNRLASAQLDLLTCTAAGVCSDSLNATAGTILTPASSGAVLFSFHTSNPLPYVDVEKAAGNPAPTSIELADSNNAVPPFARNADATTLEQFLSPIVPITNATAPAPGSASSTSTPASTSTQTTEPGMPFIDGNGKIIREQLFNTKSLVTIADIENLEKQLVLPPGQALSQLLNKNTLSQQWDTGIIDYEQGKNSEAVQTLTPLQNASSTFQAPAAFIKKAQTSPPTNNGTPGATPTITHGQSNQGALSFLSIPLLVIGLIAAILVLVLLFLWVSITYGRGRLERIKEKESKASSSVWIQIQLGRLNNLFNKFKQALQTHTPDTKTLDPQIQHPQRTPSYVLCPNCGQTVPNGAAFCPNCHYAPSPNVQSSRPTVNTSLAPAQPAVAAPVSRNSIQPQQPAQAPKMQDDPAIQASLQRLWDKAGR